ncbi:hypothetical protein ON010_g1242 [Phytophthora cinnamomi]|nr:hypothetical protein ON010_g1242 [Phytophthora cinnamomi]
MNQGSLEKSKEDVLNSSQFPRRFIILPEHDYIVARVSSHEGETPSNPLESRLSNSNRSHLTNFIPPAHSAVQNFQRQPVATVSVVKLTSVQVGDAIASTYEIGILGTFRFCATGGAGGAVGGGGTDNHERGN